MKRAAFIAATMSLALKPTLAAASEHSDDLALGQKVYNDLKTKDQIVFNSPFNAVLQQTGASIARAAGPQWYTERFYVVRGNQMNAFSAPGGYVFVNEGLLRNADNVDELACVLGHETAHLVLGHVSARNKVKERRDVLFKLGRMFSKNGSAGAQNTFNIAGQAGNYTFLGFDRQQEYEADRVGTTLAAKAGYNPWGAIWYFRETERLGSDAGFEQYVQQHPSTSDRISALERYFKKNPRRFAHWPSRMTNRGGLPTT